MSLLWDAADISSGLTEGELQDRYWTWTRAESGFRWPKGFAVVCKICSWCLQEILSSFNSLLFKGAFPCLKLLQMCWTWNCYAATIYLCSLVCIFPHTWTSSCNLAVRYVFSTPPAPNCSTDLCFTCIWNHQNVLKASSFSCLQKNPLIAPMKYFLSFLHPNKVAFISICMVVICNFIAVPDACVL